MSNVSNNSVDFWEALASCTPLLTDLRLSGIKEDLQLPRFLEILFRMSSGDTGLLPLQSYEDEEHTLVKAAASIAVKLPDLQSIYVRPRINRLAARAMQDIHEMMLKSLREVAHDTEGAVGRRLYVLPEDMQNSLDDVRGHWADVARGGDGPWSLQADSIGPWTR